MTRLLHTLSLTLSTAASIGAVATAVFAFSTAVLAAERDRTRPSEPAIEVPHPRPPLLGRPPSPGNSEAGSPVRDYIYRPPADSGSITDRLVPPSTVRPGPRGY